MFLIHYGYRYYTNDTPWNTQTALPQKSNEVKSLAKNVEGQSMQHTNITQTRRIKRELTCLAQLFIFGGLIIFSSWF